MDVELQLGYPPSLNRYYRHVRGMTLISREGRDYRAKVNAAVKARAFPRFRGKVRMTAEFYPPDALRRDLDNVLKCLLDSLTKAGAWDDDSQVKIMHLKMMDPVDKEAAMSWVKISEILP